MSSAAPTPCNQAGAVGEPADSSPRFTTGLPDAGLSVMAAPTRVGSSSHCCGAPGSPWSESQSTTGSHRPGSVGHGDSRRRTAAHRPTASFPSLRVVPLRHPWQDNGRGEFDHYAATYQLGPAPTETSRGRGASSRAICSRTMDGLAPERAGSALQWLLPWASAEAGRLDEPAPERSTVPAGPGSGWTTPGIGP